VGLGERILVACRWDTCKLGRLAAGLRVCAKVCGEVVGSGTVGKSEVVD
jgi:hypothetical protein